jgi:hypothetical protein
VSETNTKKKRKFGRVLWRILLFLGFNAVFTAGLIWVGYKNRVRIKKWMDHSNSFSPDEKIIMYDIFSAPLISEDELLLPPVKNSDDLVSDLMKASLPDTLDLLMIYDSCRFVSAEKIRNDVLRIRYVLFKDTLQGYAFVKKTGSPGNKNKKAVIYTSGTGDNRTWSVAHREIPTEDPMPQAEQAKADIYYPVFPGDDIEAIHDGTKKLDIVKVAPYMVSIGRNIPLRYLANIFALEKYLRTNYSVLHSWGHSRGGMTATISASVFHPDTLIANAGWSVNIEKFFRLGPDQMWWAHSSKYLNKYAMRSRFCGQPTRVFFLWGTKEQDIYGLETKNNTTKEFFKDCPNVSFRYAHDKPHVWFAEDVSKILAGK